MIDKPAGSCPTCKGTDWYWPGDYYMGPKEWLCTKCHPAPKEKEIISE